MSPETAYDRVRHRYQTQQVPWDLELPPPEVISLTGELAPGRALDLGSGFGRAAVYLARHGWVVDGIDFIDLAVAEATRRTADLGLPIHFYQADITNLHFLAGPYDWAIDVGCAHSLTIEQWLLHHAELKRLLRPGGHYLLYGRLHQPPETWGLDEPHLLTLLQDGFTLVDHVHSTTHMPDGSSWPSAWYTFKRV